MFLKKHLASFWPYKTSPKLCLLQKSGVAEIKENVPPKIKNFSPSGKILTKINKGNYFQSIRDIPFLVFRPSPALRFPKNPINLNASFSMVGSLLGLNLRCLSAISIAICICNSPAPRPPPAVDDSGGP